MRKKSWKLIGLVVTAAIMLAGCLGPGYHLVTPTLKNNTAKPGLWHTFGGNGCYWARLNGLGEVIAAESSPSGPRYAEVVSGDTWFRTQNCVTWAQADGPFDRHGVGVSGGTFGNGDYRVGVDISSGVYTASQSSGCYWSRLSGFSGDTSDTIQSSVGSGTVAIQPSDAGFSSTGCGTWSFTSSKANQTITFGTLSDRGKVQSFTVSATASSGLAVTFSTTTPSVCTWGGTNGSTITTFNTAGTCTVRASQAGNATYNPAPSVDRSFAVT